MRGIANGSANVGYAVQAINSSASGWGIYASGTSPNYFAGSVGIGTTSPTVALDVNGAIKSAAVSNAGSSIDFSSGNLQYTSDSCEPLTLNNLKSGATYSLAVQGTAGGTCSFTAFSGNGSGALTIKSGSTVLTQTASKHVVFSFMVMGNFVYVAAADGY